MNNYFRADTFQDLSITECGKETCIPNKSVINSKKDYFLFHCIISGKGCFEIGNKSYTLGKKDIFFIPPNTSAHYYPDKDDPWTYIWIGVNGLSVQELLKEINVNLENPIIKDDNEDSLKKYFTYIYSEYYNSAYLNLSCLGYAYLLFGELTKRIESNTKITNPKNIVNFVCEAIKNNYQFGIKIKDVAVSIGIGPNYLSDIFKKDMGITPKRFLTNIRMKEASKFLLSKTYNINEVSKKLGYKNQLQFCNEFKKYFGDSPTQYIIKNTQ